MQLQHYVLDSEQKRRPRVEQRGPVASRTGTFLRNVPYTLQAIWGSVNLLLDTNGSNGSSVVAQGLRGGAISGNLTLNFATAASSSLVSQGSYHDTVLITIGTPM